MPIRRYNAAPTPRRTTALAPIIPQWEECSAIPQGAKLVDHKTLQQHLLENYQIPFSYTTFTQHRRDGKLREGYHFRKIQVNRAVRFYVPNMERFFGV